MWEKERRSGLGLGDRRHNALESIESDCSESRTTCQIEKVNENHLRYLYYIVEFRVVAQDEFTLHNSVQFSAIKFLRETTKSAAG